VGCNALWQMNLQAPGSLHFSRAYCIQFSLSINVLGSIPHCPFQSRPGHILSQRTDSLGGGGCPSVSRNAIPGQLQDCSSGPSDRALTVSHAVSVWLCKD